MRADVRHVSQNPSQTWETVEQCVYALQLDYRDGRAQTLDQYLPEGGVALRRMVLVELIKVELELLWKE
jgi:hypothetical protein